MGYTMASLKRRTKSVHTGTERALSKKTARLRKPEISGAVIRFEPKHADKGFAILFSHGQVGMVGEDKYAVGPEHIALLKRAGVPYQVVAT